MPVSSDVFRQTLGRFATGVTIITFRNDKGIHGLTVNAFTSVSLDPPLIAICIKNGGLSQKYLSETNRFVVNILSEEQQKVGGDFANPRLSSKERFERLGYRESMTGIPILSDNLAHLECRIVNKHDGGDHTIFIGEVDNAAIREDARPLLYYASAFHTL